VTSRVGLREKKGFNETEEGLRPRGVGKEKRLVIERSQTHQKGGQRREDEYFRTRENFYEKKWGKKAIRRESFFGKEERGTRTRS